MDSSPLLLNSQSFYNSNLKSPYSCLSFSFPYLNLSRKRFSSSFVSVSTFPIKPTSRCRLPCSRIRPFSSLGPVLKKLKDFAVESSKFKWVSSFRGLGMESFSTEFLWKREGRCLENGAFGVALMSVTSTAKVKISPFVATLAANPTFVSALFAWFIAQSCKVFLNFWVERKWDFRIMFASGGMPSSHSALCTALTTSVAICHGVADSLFPVCLGFSLIVMYDAIGVRRHAGMQAEVLNVIIEDLFQGHPISQRKLKELLGHTPLQVVAGALLGIFVAWFCCQSCGAILV